MRLIRQSPFILIIGGIAGVFLLLSLSRTAPVNRTLKADAYSAKMQLALDYMEQSPMAGVKMFRKIVQQYPKRYETPFQLGTFAMRTSQFHKAAGWFEKAATLAPTSESKAISLLNWSDAMVMDNKQDSARLILKSAEPILREMFKYSKDSLLLRSLNERINALK